MSDKTKIYIIDFEDSFTFNVASELYCFLSEIVVISHLDFFSANNFSVFINCISDKTAIILGPGPGNPKDYEHYFLKILQIKNHPLLYLMGICLGHQVLALIDGLCVKNSLNPIHGQQVNICFNNKSVLVQRYNSLGVFSSFQGTNEIQIRKWENGISYQFHPESIGTENSALFFKDLLDFVR
jgi:anthranilate/para-aminobenzoate synthase component II